MNPMFKETQRFTQWWIWLILIFVGAIPLVGIYKQLILGESFGDKPMSNTGIVLFAVFIFGMIALFAIMRLNTYMDKQLIRMQFIPFVKKEVYWRDVKSAEVINYGFVGGWGIRLWTAYGTVYNMRGNKGLALELHDGSKFLIGTQNEVELQEFLNKRV